MEMVAAQPARQTNKCNMDIQLAFLDTYFDLQILNNDLANDDGLKTAIYISLFSDRRVNEEELPIEEKERRGHWADALNDTGDLLGSKLWLLKRQKITPQLLIQAKQYCEEALAWLVEDGIADEVQVVTERLELYQVSIEIELLRRHDGNAGQKFSFVWESVADGVSKTFIA